MDADDQAIQTILLDLPEDVYDVVDSCETAKDIWERVQQMMKGNGKNQFGQYTGQVAQNQQGYNAWQNGGIQVAQNAAQNAGAQNGGLRELEIGIKPGDLDEIEEVNANCIVMANLQHASTSDTQLDKAPVYDTDGSD
nr:hypothetical protein [Tanacetum cinerariifolium]